MADFATCTDRELQLVMREDEIHYGEVRRHRDD
jgi:hypothetical protein